MACIVELERGLAAQMRQVESVDVVGLVKQEVKVGGNRFRTDVQRVQLAQVAEEFVFFKYIDIGADTKMSEDSVRALYNFMGSHRILPDETPDRFGRLPSRLPGTCSKQKRS